MIDKELFFKFYNEKISSDNCEMQSEFIAFQQHWDEFMECYLNKEVQPNTQSSIIQLNYLYAIIWSDLSMCTLSRNKDNIDNLVFSSLATTISNNLIAIIALSLNGLDYQAMNILRNLYEIGLLTLNICINGEKRKHFFQSAKKQNSYEVWRKYFRTSSMLDTIQSYSSSESLQSYWKKDLKEYYSRLSAFVHNSLANIYIFSFSEPKDATEDHYLNVCAHFASRYEQILKEAVDLIWVITKVFRFLMEDVKFKDFFDNLLGSENEKYLRHAKNGCYFADYYYLLLNKLGE